MRSIYDYERKIKLNDNSVESLAYGQGSRCDTTIAKTYYYDNKTIKNGFELILSNNLQLNAFTHDRYEKSGKDLIFDIRKDDPLYVPLSKALMYDKSIVLEDEAIKKSPKSVELIRNHNLIKIKFNNSSKTMVHNESKWNLQINISNISNKLSDNGKFRLLKFFTDAQNVYFDMDKKELEEEKEERQAKEYAKIISYPSVHVSGVM